MRPILFLALLLLPLFSWAQSNQESTSETMVLLFDKMGSNRAAWFVPGDTIRYRLKGSKEWTMQVFERFTDDGRLRFTLDTVALDEFRAIDIWEKDHRRKMNAVWGRTIIVAAVALLVIDQVNQVIGGAKPNISWRVVSYSGTMTALGGWLIFKGKRTQRVGGRWRLRITPLPLRFVEGFNG